MEKRTFLKNSLAVAGATAISGVAPAIVRAQEPIKLRISHFLSPMAPVHTMLFQPWVERIERDSGGRIKCEIYPAMQLGGKPPQLYDQARTGVADVVWTVPGYTPGRFPKAAVFDLPFVVGNTAEATARAIWDFYKIHLREENKDVHVLLMHCHAPAVIHMTDKLVAKMEDLSGKRLRLPTKPVGDAFRLMNAIPVGMPMSEAYEALSRGVVNGIAAPWEVMKPQRMNELCRYHTENNLYTSVFIIAMNRQKYESLPDNLKEVIDRNSGDNWIREAGGIWDKAELPGLEQAKGLGHTIIRLSDDETARWRKTAQPVIDAWVSATPDGQRLYDEAIALIGKYEKA